MTREEFEYIKRAMEVIEGGQCSPMAQAKILKTVGQICDRGAESIKQNLIDQVDVKLVRNYQKTQNQKLVDILKH